MEAAKVDTEKHILTSVLYQKLIKLVEGAVQLMRGRLIKAAIPRSFAAMYEHGAQFIDKLRLESMSLTGNCKELETHLHRGLIQLAKLRLYKNATDAEIKRISIQIDDGIYAILSTLIEVYI